MENHHHTMIPLWGNVDRSKKKENIYWTPVGWYQSDWPQSWPYLPTSYDFTMCTHNLSLLHFIYYRSLVIFGTKITATRVILSNTGGHFQQPKPCVCTFPSWTGDTDYTIASSVSTYTEYCHHCSNKKWCHTHPKPPIIPLSTFYMRTGMQHQRIVSLNYHLPFPVSRW